MAKHDAPDICIKFLELFPGARGVTVRQDPFGGDTVIECAARDRFTGITGCTVMVSDKAICEIDGKDDALKSLLLRTVYKQIDRDDFDELQRKPTPAERRADEAYDMLTAALADTLPITRTPSPVRIDDILAPDELIPAAQAIEIVERQLAAVARFDWSMRMVRRLGGGRTWGDMCAEEERES